MIQDYHISEYPQFQDLLPKDTQYFPILKDWKELQEMVKDCNKRMDFIPYVEPHTHCIYLKQHIPKEYEKEIANCGYIIGNAVSHWSPKRQKKVPEYKIQVIQLISEGKLLTEAAKSSGVKTRVVRAWITEDEVFAKDIENAETDAMDVFETEARRRAKDGVEEFVVSHGKVVMHPETGQPLKTHRFSDGLLQFILKGRRRDVFGDKKEVDTNVSFDTNASMSDLERKFAAITAAEEDEKKASEK
jgi:predicted nucleic acid-binding Zn ribbon protein